MIEAGFLDTADPVRVFSGGGALARLHEALAAYPDASRVVDGQADPSPPLATGIIDWLDASAGNAPPQACNALRRKLSAARLRRLPIQLVHGYFRSANVLCRGSEVVAVLDFEEVRLDYRIVELARSAVLLGTRFRDWGPVSTEVRARFLAGYEALRRLTPDEVRWWDILVLWLTLAMISTEGDQAGWRDSAIGQVDGLGAVG